MLMSMSKERLRDELLRAHDAQLREASRLSEEQEAEASERRRRLQVPRTMQKPSKHVEKKQGKHGKTMEKPWKIN